MKALLISFLVAVAIIATVALNPKSGWIFQNQIDLIKGRGEPSNLMGGELFDPYVPNWLTRPETYSGNTEAQQLAHARFDREEAKYNASSKFAATYPTQAFAWAALCQVITLQGPHMPDEPIKSTEHLPDYFQSRLVAGIAASRRGEDLEPNNGYFSLIRATFCMEANRPEEMEAALRSGAAKSGYENHFREQNSIVQAALLEARGYRGELLNAVLEASTLLPDYSHIRLLGRFLNRHGSMAEKRDLIQLMHLMGQKEDTAIGILVARSMAVSVITPPQAININSYRFTDPELIQFARGFDSQVLAAKIAPSAPNAERTLRGLNGLVEATHFYFRYLENTFPEEFATHSSIYPVVVGTLGPYFALGALFLSLLFGTFTLAAGRLKQDWIVYAAPHLICIPAAMCLASTFSGCCQSINSPVAMVFAFCQMALAFLCLEKRPAIILTIAALPAAAIFGFSPALILYPMWRTVPIVLAILPILPFFLDLSKRRRIATIAGVVLALAALTSFDPSAVACSLMFAAALGFRRVNEAGKKPKVLDWIRGALFLAACGFGGIVLAVRGPSETSLPYAIASVVFVGMAAAMLFVGRPMFATRAIVSTALITFSTLYLLTAGVELSENNKLKLTRPNIFNEGDRIREIARKQAQGRRLD